MKKLYRIFLLILILIFLSTYNPKELGLVADETRSLFAIKNIEIKDNLLIQEDDIKKKLKYIYKKNIFFIKKEDLAEPIGKIDFLHKIEVKKRYPNTISIKIFETKPVAIFVKNKTRYILDSSSNLIFKNDIEKFGKLPNVFGEGAEKSFIFFQEKLNKNNFPYNKIINYYYFQIDRWDIQLSDNKVIKFPNNNIDKAIIKSIELLDREDFKNYNIIDLRVDGKIIVE